MKTTRELSEAYNATIDGQVTIANFMDEISLFIDEVVNKAPIKKQDKEDAIQIANMYFLENIRNKKYIKRVYLFKQTNEQAILRKISAELSLPEIPTEDIFVEENFNEIAEQYELEEKTREIINTLERSREREIVKSYLGFDGVKKNFREIGEDYDVSNSRIHEIFSRSIRKLKSSRNEMKKIEDYAL